MENYNNVDIIEQIWEIIEKLRLKLASVINGSEELVIKISATSVKLIMPSTGEW